MGGPETVADQSQLNTASNWIFFQCLLLYLVIVVTIALVARANLPAELLLISPIACLVIGWCQFALFNALHEGLHRRFGQPHRELLSLALTAWPLGFDTSYRCIHLDHHRYFGEADRDPDYPNYSAFPRSRREFAGRLLLNISGIKALQQFYNACLQARHEQPEKGAWFGIATMQVALCATFSMTIGISYYFLLWLLPLATVAKFFTSTRTFCEHGDPRGRPIIRTITGPLLGVKIFGVFCFHYHGEHHRNPSIPYLQLQAAHQASSNDQWDQPNEQETIYQRYDQGYLQLLRDWYRDLPS